MSSTKYSDLEKSVKFKSRFVPKSIWKKNFIYLLAPIILLFFSVFSLIYIFEAGRLATLITIPYGLIFLLSVVFLRLSRLYVIKKEVNKPNQYLFCLGKVVKEENKIVYVAFSKDTKRHDNYYIEKSVKELVPEVLPSLSVKDEVHILEHENGQLCIKVFRKKELLEKKMKHGAGDILYLEYVDNKNVLLISERKMKL